MYVEWPFALVGVFLKFSLIVLVAAQEYMMSLVGFGTALSAAMYAGNPQMAETDPIKTGSIVLKTDLALQRDLLNT